MRVEVFESLSAIPASIADRCSYPSQQNFFLSLDWFSCLYDTALCASVTTRVYCLIDHNNEPVGMLFCGARAGERALYSLTNFYTMEFAPVLLSKSVPLSEFLLQVIEYIRSEQPRWKKINFRFLSKDLLEDTQLKNILGDRRFFAYSFFMYENWYIGLSGRNFDTYLLSRSSRLRNTIARKTKKLGKSHSYEIELHTKPSPRVAHATKDYVAIYNKSWKNPEPFPDFIPELIAVTSKLGLLRLGILYIDSKPAAAQLWITTHTKAVIYKLAYDEDYAEFSPGSILSNEMFRYAIDVDHVEEIDYGVGSENYKKEWMETVRIIEGILAFNLNTIEGFSLSVTEYVKSLAKKVTRLSR